MYLNVSHVKIPFICNIFDISSVPHCSCPLKEMYNSVFYHLNGEKFRLKVYFYCEWTSQPKETKKYKFIVFSCLPYVFMLRDKYGGCYHILKL